MKFTTEELNRMEKEICEIYFLDPDTQLGMSVNDLVLTYQAAMRYRMEAVRQIVPQLSAHFPH